MRRDTRTIQEEEYTSGEDTGDRVVTEDEVMDQRLSRLEELLNGRPRQERRDVSTTRSGKRDDFSLAAGDSQALDIYDDSPDVITVRNQVRKLTGEDPGEEVGRALLSMIGATLGANIGGPTGAGIGAALASLLYSKTRVNPLEALLGKKQSY